MQKHKKISSNIIHAHERWLSIASNDIRSSKKLIQGNDPILDTAIYHTQQCAEKSLKALLIFKQQTVPKTHDLERLLSLCIVFEKNFEKLWESVSLLNPYSSIFRYPDDFIEPSIEDVIEAMHHAEIILLFVKKVINEHNNPTKKIFK